MAAEVQLGLLLILTFLIGTINADWGTPPFIQPDPLDDVVNFLGYSASADQTNIELDEEVTYHVTIAVLNYTGTDTPTVGTFEDGKSNLILGAVIEQNSTTGLWAVVITKAQDYETASMQTYRFFIVGNSVSRKIALNIQNIDDNAPVIQADERSCSIEENWSGLTNCSFLISDADGWIDQITLDFTSTPTEGTQKFSFTEESSDTDFQKTSYLNVIEELDYETYTMYLLVIEATDGAGNVGSTTYIVTVIDMPDEPPKWTSIISAENILEKSTNEFSVSAIDGDIGINADINYRIVTTEERDEEYFVVNATTGVITINPIDRDALAQEVFRFLIVAYEVDDVDSKINSTVIIIVEDINDHIPEVSPEELSISILEETYMTLTFNESIVISDPDLAENAQFTVALSDDSEYNWNSAFLIIPTTGYQSGTFTITVINSSLLDYEDEDWRNITIQIIATEVANTSHIGTRDINIQLINWNDELPIFENDTVEVSVPEDVEMGYLIATMLATDRDVDDNVTHTLVAQRTLAIDEVTGEVTTGQEGALDYETIPIVVAQIVATDLGDHKTYATLTINVIDVNDVPPSLYMPSSAPRIEEEVDNGTIVNTTIYATDPDTDAHLVFSIDWDNSYASKSGVVVNASEYEGHLEIETSYPENNTLYAEATIVVSGRLDFETFDLMYLTIMVTDTTTVHNDNSSSALMTLVITDINDNAPVFSSYYSMSVTENESSEIQIGSITATDADGPGNNNVVYYIEPTNGTASDLVYISTATGVIRVLEDMAIDAEKYEYLYYDVIASDGVWNTTEPIEIYVIDQNDEIPYVLSDEFNSTIYIKEKSATGTEIVKISAADDDRTSPFNNVSYIINTDYSELYQYFALEKYTGLLTVSLSDGHILDRDFGTSTFTVQLILRDNFLVETITWNSNVITTSVTVILEDINDQIPELPDLSDPAATISENAANGTLVLTVTATDYDEPNTNNTKVFYKILSVSATDNTTEIADDCPVLFRVETFNDTDALIYTNCDLKGYYGTWAVELYAQDLGTDPGPQNDTKTYNIFIEDYNYYSPVITSPAAGTSLRLSRNQVVNSQLYTYDLALLSNFTATDEDSGNSGTVTFSISADNDTLKYFRVVSAGTNTAQLQLLSIPNFDAVYVYVIDIIATDGGSPSRSVTQTHRVLFISTEGPEFETNTWVTWFRENTTGFDDYSIIPAAYDMVNEDAEEEDIVATYYFFTSNDDDMAYFSLDKETRNLTLTEMLDRESQETMQLFVVATASSEGPPENPRAAAILNITVVVVDVNDNPPVFESSSYTAGVTTEDAIGKLILTVVANDADLNDSLTYSIDYSTFTTSDSSLDELSDPFSLNSLTGDLTLLSVPTSSMTGYFSFNVIVHDEVNHTDTTNVKVYIVSESNRVTFTFKNNVTYVEEEEAYVISSFTNAFGYKCNVDYIKNSLDDDGNVLDNTTSVTTHFIDESDHLPIESDVIIVASSDLETITNLQITLLARYLYLYDVPTSVSTTVTDIQAIIQWVFICLTIFLFICCIALLVAYIIRTKTLTERLDKLAVTNFGSQESGLNRIGALPGSNKFAQEGSNPMWKTDGTKIQEDNISQGSGDSDLVGIENNPNFSYTNDILAPDSEWNNERESSFNPVMMRYSNTFQPGLDSTSEENSNRLPNGLPNGLRNERPESSTDL